LLAVWIVTVAVKDLVVLLLRQATALFSRELLANAPEGLAWRAFGRQDANFFAFGRVSRIMAPSGTGIHVSGDFSGTHRPKAERSGGMPVALA
jgi:hypothetical protein